MDPRLTGLLTQFETVSWLVDRALADLSDSDAAYRPDGKTNSIQFLVGHMALSRAGLLRLAGLEAESKWRELYQRGTAVEGTETYPPFGDVKLHWADLSARLGGALAHLSPERLDQASTPDGDPDETVLKQIAFLALHEVYHVGQIAYIRRLLGYDRLVG